MTRRMNAKKISKSILALLMAVPALFTTNVMAQELKKPTLEDLIPGGETYHTAENKWYQWWGDAACLELGIDNIEGTWAVKGLGAKPGETFTAITLEEANALLEEKGLGTTASLSCCKGCQRTPRRQSGYSSPNRPTPAAEHRQVPCPRRLEEEKSGIWSQPCPAQAANEDWNEVSRTLGLYYRQ